MIFLLTRHRFADITGKTRFLAEGEITWEGFWTKALELWWSHP
jgi:hypothetical protein